LAVRYPIKIRDAYAQLAQCYRTAALDVLAQRERGALTGQAQREEDATYSMWRDESDHFIDWSWSAERIKRFVDAVGWPYTGAQTRYRAQVIRVDEAEVVPEVRFVVRQPGKVWAVHDGAIDVVCGSGLLRIVAATGEDGRPLLFKYLRERLG
jgi:methionyl-tRNA formyltransferase